MQNFDPQNIVEILKGFMPKNMDCLALHEPHFAGNEWDYVKSCLDSGWVSSAGKFVDRFEKDLADFTGAKHAIVVANGTAALHAIYLLANICANDEVLVPTLTFVATCNALAYCGAIPHFVDVDKTTLGVDPKKLEDYLQNITEIKNNVCINKFTQRPIKALVVMHTFGHPVDLDPIVEICSRYHIKLIEDAAEALGSLYKGKHVGHTGLAGALSFNGNKIITAGGGGAILTNDAKFAKRAKHITTTAKQPHDFLYVHDEIGYNYRMPNINAALGCAQLEQISNILSSKRNLAKQYEKLFANIEGISFFAEPSFAKSNYWLNTLLLNDEHCMQRDNVLRLANSSGIKIRPIWTLMHKLPMFADCPRMDLSTACDLEQRIINIPSSVFLCKR